MPDFKDLPEYPAFRMSRHLFTENMCLNWFEHFKERGIPCAIVREDKRSKPYSVWRIGREVTPIKPGQNYYVTEPNNERIDGVIIRECHMFKEYLP
jgi:hypothetical protein